VTTLNQSDRFELANALGESPQTCIAIHALRSGRCRVAISGKASQFDAVVIDALRTPGELFGFGNDLQSIWKLAKAMTNWVSIEVFPDLADPLSKLIERDTGQQVRREADLFFAGCAPIKLHPHPAVRLLTDEDLNLYADSAIRFADDPAQARRNLVEGPIAAAIFDGKVVSAVEANIRTRLYANLAAETLPNFRSQGLCTSAASMVAQAVQAMNLTPVWSCDETNSASQRVARKLGLTESSSMVYLIPEKTA
jgi:hypothetical protein